MNESQISVWAWHEKHGSSTLHFQMNEDAWIKNERFFINHLVKIIYVFFKVLYNDYKISKFFNKNSINYEYKSYLKSVAHLWFVVYLLCYIIQGGLKSVVPETNDVPFSKIEGDSSETRMNIFFGIRKS